MIRDGVGGAMRPVEDSGRLTGRGCYLNDVQLAGALVAAFVPSTEAHAPRAAGRRLVSRLIQGDPS